MAEIRERLTLEDQFTAPLTKYLKIVQSATTSTKALQDATKRFTAVTKAQTAAYNTATAAAKAQLAELKLQEAQQKKAASSTDALTGKVKNLIGAYVGFKGLSALFNLSDTMAQNTARLDRMNDGLQTTSELNQMIYESAQRSRGAYQATADMVSKFGTLAGEAFDSSAEVVAFAEQINKQIALSGASTASADAAMLQLTQAMSSGGLRGEELNSILEQTPTIAKTIANYLGVSTGKMREMASEGKITAEVVKNAMFAAAEETNAAFKKMPMTWGQVWTSAQNILIKTFQPVLKIVGAVATVVGDNMDIAIAAFYGLAAAVAVYAAAQWIATAAAKGFFKTLLTNPIFYIAIAIGLVVFAIYQWIQSVGGLHNAWLIVVDGILYAWDTLRAGFMTGVYAVMNWLDMFALAWFVVSVNVQNFIGDMKVKVLSILQSMVNGAIDIINWFISQLNKIPGVSIDPIEKMTFATTAAAENEAAKQARNASLNNKYQKYLSDKATRAQDLADMWAQRDADHAARQQEIQQNKLKKMSGSNATSDFSGIYGSAGAASGLSGISDSLGGISKDVGSIEKSVDMSQEDIKSLVDVAERRYVNQINLTAQTPVINVSGQNTGNTAEDRKNLADAIRDILIEQVASGSTRSTARAY